jgi:uncharacterized membrane protein YhaH (DUF805 family)
MKKSRVIFLGVILLLFVVAVIVIIANINKASIKGYNLCYDDAYKEAMNNLDVSLCELVAALIILIMTIIAGALHIECCV